MQTGKMPTKDEISRATRLRQLRKAQYPSAAEFIRKFDLSEPTYNAHERGFRAFREPTAKQYAKILNSTYDYIWTGKVLNQSITYAPVVGSITRIGEIVAKCNLTGDLDMSEQTALETVAMPPDADEYELNALIQNGDGQYFKNGMVVYYSRLASNIEECLGEVCVIGLANDIAVIAMLSRGSSSELYNVSGVGPDQKVEWASPIEWTKRKR